MATKNGIAAAVLVAGVAMGPACSPVEDESSRDVECGPDPIHALVDDSEMRALSEGPPAEFTSLWLTWNRCMAERGNIESQMTLGIVYRDGSDGPPQNYSEAAAWFRRAAEQAHPMGQFNLERLHEDGRGVSKDFVQAHMWYNLAASGSPWSSDLRGMAFAKRDEVESLMTSAQVAEAQKMATEWYSKEIP